MNNNLINKYQNRIDSFSRNLKKLKKQINLVSLLRLLVFVSGLVSGVLLFNTHLSLSLAIFSFALILFLFLLKIHKGLFENKLFFSQLVEINKEEIECLKGNFESFNPGNEFSNNDHPYSSDLDLFGSGSLFQYINRTGTKTGKNILADWLKTRGDREEIILRQEAIKELRDKIDLRQKFQATGRNSKETDNDIPEIQKWANQAIIYANSTFYLSILYILPAITIILFLLSVFYIPVNIPIMLALFQLGIIGINLRKINKHHTQTSKKYKLLNNYSLLINIIENEHFSSEKLLQLKKKLIFSDRSASTNLKNLAKIVDAFDNRINMIVGFILNGLLMWDLQCMIRLERWKLSFKNEIPKWISVLGEFETLLSLAGLSFNNPEFVIPSINSSDFILKADEMGHPLIPKKERVCNNIDINGLSQFMIITGSNMAGKSTYLRTVGINLVLAMCGSVVCANKFEFFPIQVYSSMRVWDSLNKGESTFYAELKRLKEILEYLDKENTLIFLDEILKGTNSRDKHIGSESLIKHLIINKGVGLIATHDLALTDMESRYPENIKNYSFEVKIKNDRFIFDYKLQQSICRTLNATHLMKKMGLSVDE